jgi:hypothetical protein
MPHVIGLRKIQTLQVADTKSKQLTAMKFLIHLFIVQSLVKAEVLRLHFNALFSNCSLVNHAHGLEYQDVLRIDVPIELNYI